MRRGSMDATGGSPATGELVAPDPESSSESIPSGDGARGAAAPRWTPPVLVALIVGVLQAAAGFPAVHHGFFDTSTWAGPSDMAGHAQEGMALAFPEWWNPRIPHFGLHLVTRLVSVALGITDYRVSMMLVVVASIGIYGAMLFLLFDRALQPATVATRSIAILLSFAVGFAEAPTGLRGWSYQMPPDFFLPLNMPHTPTSLVSRPVAVALFFVTWRFLRKGATRDRTLMAALVVASMVTKPAFAPSLAVAACAWCLLARQDPNGRRRLRDLVLWFLVPMAAVMAYQVVAVASLPPQYAASIALHPWKELSDMGAGSPWFWTVYALPVAGLVVLGERARSGQLGFANGVMGVSVLIAFLFATPGGVPYSGDTLHFAQHGVLVATVVLVCSTGQMARAHWDRSKRAVLILSLVALPYVVSGWSMWSCHGGGPCLAR